MHPFPKYSELRSIIELAREEDLHGDDVTSRLMVSEDAIGVGTLMQKEIGIACGLPIVEMICRVYDERLRVELIPGFHMEIIEGRFSDQRATPLLRIRGPMRSLLSAERVVLNFLQRMSGVATHTHRFVRKIAGTGAKIYDTRKTIPGFRSLDKYGVLCGGGKNHRIGLYDGLLIKDNHLSKIPPRDIASFVQKAANSCRTEDPSRLIEVEVDTLEQLREVLKVEGLHVVLLDNMDCPKMQMAVELRDKVGLKGKVDLEASGGVTLETVRSIAETGVERIAVGAITHSAPALDIGLDVEE
jgi:nicotinate-nucleotide pyrophosphorylase (carboxylating)